MNPEQWLSLKWNGGSTMSDRWLNQSKIIQFVEGDVFRLIVPLNEDYSYDNVKNGDKKTAIKNGDKKISKKTIQNYKKILEFMEEGKEYTIQDFCNLLNLKPSRTKELLKALTQDIEQIGNNKNRKYRLK